MPCRGLPITARLRAGHAPPLLKQRRIVGAAYMPPAAFPQTSVCRTPTGRIYAAPTTYQPVNGSSWANPPLISPLRGQLPPRGKPRLSKNSLAPSGRGLRPQAVGERASRRHEGFGQRRGSLPPALRATSLPEGGFLTHRASPEGEAFFIFTARRPRWSARRCRCP